MRAIGSGAGCLAAGVVILLILALAFGLVPFILMLAWNAVVPSAFGGPTLSFLQAFALWFVVSIIGGAFRSTTTVSARR